MTFISTMKLSVYHFIFVTGAVLAVLSGCYYDNKEELHPELLLNGNCDTTVVIKYSTDIQPILNNSCGANNSCHGSSSTSGIPLNAYNDTRSVAVTGKLWSAIVWDGNASQMPQGSSSQINDCYQAKIRKWIDEGAPDN